MTLSPRLSPRRFPETIVRWRETPAERNAAGEYVEGDVIETELRASVQPIALTDTDIAGGVSLDRPLEGLCPGAGRATRRVR